MSDNTVYPGHGHNEKSSISDNTGLATQVNELSLRGGHGAWCCDVGRAAGGLEKYGRQAVGGAQREGERSGDEGHEHAAHTPATPRGNPRRKRRE
jgi:hypothetical protein